MCDMLGFAYWPEPGIYDDTMCLAPLRCAGIAYWLERGMETKRKFLAVFSLLCMEFPPLFKLRTDSKLCEVVDDKLL